MVLGIHKPICRLWTVLTELDRRSKYTCSVLLRKAVSRNVCSNERRKSFVLTSWSSSRVDSSNLKASIITSDSDTTELTNLGTQLQAKTNFWT